MVRGLSVEASRRLRERSGSEGSGFRNDPGFLYSVLTAQGPKTGRLVTRPQI